MKRTRISLILIGLIWLTAGANASVVLPMTLDEHVQSAGAIFRGTVVAIQSFRNAADGMIYTRSLFRVDEAFKGKFPPVVKLVQRGGEVDGVGNFDDLSPQFKVGEECVLFVARRKNGTLFADQGDAGVIRLQRQANGIWNSQSENYLNRLHTRTDGGTLPGADVTDQSADSIPVGSISAPSGDSSGTSTNGLLADSYGVPSRFCAPDRGEAIPYLVDATYLPTGITLSQALGAVSNAFAAWASASSLKFVFAGTQNFGQAAANINTNDGVFRIQLHDAYNFIPPGNILGEGGSYFTAGLLTNANWGRGGKVTGMEFNKGLCGYVVLKQTNVAMQTLSTFTEVLTHEIGHAIGLAHSSNVVTNDPVLTNSIMYFLAHEDGRGASLNSYDTNVVREAYPLNPPPYAYDRVMDITTSPYGPVTNISGINQVQLRGYSLWTTNLTLAVTNATSGAGNFSLNGNLLVFAPNNYYSEPRVDPASSFYYDLIDARYSDGSNASPYITVRTISLNPDSDSPASDGIPDSWMTNYFGHTDPRAADKSRAGDDADGDKLSNLQEYIAGMNPRDAASAQRITFIGTNVLQWQAKAYELYEIQSTTNLASPDWTRSGNPVSPTTATGVFTPPYSSATPHQFFRIQKVP